MGGSGDDFGEFDEVGVAADLVELFLFFESVSEGEEVDGGAGVPEGVDGGEDLTVFGEIEVFRFEDVGDFNDGIGIDENGAENGLFGFERVGGDGRSRHCGDFRSGEGEVQEEGVECEQKSKRCG